MATVDTNTAEQYVDFVVVGSGTGLAAALAAHELGMTVLIIEKTDFVGGSMALSGGAFWIPGNSVIRDGGGSDPLERAAEYLDEIVGDSADDARRENFLQAGPAVVDFLKRTTRLKFMWSRGYSDYHSERRGGSAIGRTCESRPFDMSVLGEHRGELRTGSMAAPVPMPITGVDYRLINLMATIPHRGVPRAARRLSQGVGGKLLRREYAAGGQALAAGLYDAVLRAGIPVWRNTALHKLVLDGDGADTKVVGVEVVRNGEQVTIAAKKGVLLAAGGFDHDLTRRREHQLASLGSWSLGSPGNTGDTLDAAVEVGADTDLLDQAWWFPAVAPLPGQAPKVMLAERSLPGSFMVDGSGERFINEATDYMTFGQEILERERAGRSVGQMWIVFDQRYRDSYVFAGELFPRMAIPQSWYEAGIAYTSPTLSGLSEITGLPHLDTTATRFNMLATAGIDDDFRRGSGSYDRYYGDPSHGPNPTLRALDRGPFHAVKVVLSDLGTCGGLVTDSLARVLDHDGGVIRNLYASGNTAANAFGNRYPGAGATIGQGLVFGYVAAQHAAERG